MSGAAGFGLAGVLQVAALLAVQAGSGALASVVDWPTAVLRALAASEAVAFFAGFALGGLVYSVVAFLLLRKALASE